MLSSASRCHSRLYGDPRARTDCYASFHALHNTPLPGHA